MPVAFHRHKKKVKSRLALRMEVTCAAIELKLFSYRVKILSLSNLQWHKKVP